MMPFAESGDVWRLRCQSIVMGQPRPMPIFLHIDYFFDVQAF